jgi:hypothetical protein
MSHKRAYSVSWFTRSLKRAPWATARTADAAKKSLIEPGVGRRADGGSLRAGNLAVFQASTPLARPAA